MTKSSESNTSESSSAEETYTIEEELRESVFTLLNKVIQMNKKSVMVFAINNIFSIKDIGSYSKVWNLISICTI
ncbi:10636_t:CDS:2 [Funneliformis mosseae]|uniref:10636_t:CDS:1 n=1 Tax=Funneliformis mosseae TaxID=27381 RepID=A0A9N9AYF1_FUNMO|nr:10636_t:CDS:2 [Funneliformis mosseae]